MAVLPLHVRITVTVIEKEINAVLTSALYPSSSACCCDSPPGG